MVDVTVDLDIRCKCGARMVKDGEQMLMVRLRCPICYNTIYIRE